EEPGARLAQDCLATQGEELKVELRALERRRHRSPCDNRKFVAIQRKATRRAMTRSMRTCGSIAKLASHPTVLTYTPLALVRCSVSFDSLPRVTRTATPLHGAFA